MIDVNQKNTLTIPAEIPEHNYYRVQKAIEKFSSISTHLTNSVAINQNNRDHLDWIFTNSLMHLYHPIASADFYKNKKICITSFVETDGLGDLYHGLADADIVREYFPECSAINIADFPEFEERGRQLNLDELKCIILDLNKQKLTDAKVQTTMRNLREASLIIDAPYGDFRLNYSHTWKQLQTGESTAIPYSPPSKKNILHFQEYDGSPSFDDVEQPSLGLAPYHMGIIFKAPPKQKSLAEIKDSSLKEFLFKNKTPDLNDIQQYEAAHQMHYGYIKSNLTDVLTSVAFGLTVAAANRDSNKTIDLILPKTDLSIESKESVRDLFRKQGIAILQLFQKKGKDFELVEEIPVSDKGKTMRIINPFPLDNEDCKTLAYCSKNPVGCTGDMSLSEVISFFKTYIYQAAQHKGDIQNSFIEVYKNEVNGGKESPLTKFLDCYKKIGLIITGEEEEKEETSEKEMDLAQSDEEKEALIEDIAFALGEPPTKKIRREEETSDSDEKMSVPLTTEEEKVFTLAIEAGKCFSFPGIEQEMHLFSELLKKRYNFNLVLKDLIDRHFAKMQFPSLVAIEDAIREKFLLKTISLQEAHDQLKEEIVRREHLLAKE